jgi:hypothetical protein
MLQDEHGRFARDARNLAEHELVGYQIRKNRNGELGKRFDDLMETTVFLKMFCHQCSS